MSRGAVADVEAVAGAVVHDAEAVAEAVVHDAVAVVEEAAHVVAIGVNQVRVRFLHGTQGVGLSNNTVAVVVDGVAIVTRDQAAELAQFGGVIEE